MRTCLVAFVCGCAAVGPAFAGDTITVVTLGDSITKGVRPGVSADQTFASVLQAELRKEGYRADVVNVGIGSEDTDKALARLERDVLSRKPTVVTVMYGANDHWVHKGKTAPTVSPEKFAANLQTIVERVRKAGGVPVLMTTQPPVGGGAYPADYKSGPPLEEYIKATRDVAKATGTPLVDHYADWQKRKAAGTNLERWVTDAWHPNADGHREMALLIKPVVVAALKRGAK